MDSLHNDFILSYICLSETYLNPETSTDDQNLEIPGYCLLLADHPSNNKRGGVCLFYRITLPLRVLNISYLSECITFEISIGNQVCRFIHLYRSPSQTQSNLKLSLDALLCGNPFLTVMIGDFNAKSKDWSSIDITSFEGSELDFLTSQFGLLQRIKEPTHILDNSRSCIDLIFTSQPNMLIDSGVHASLHSNCHHQIIYAKFDLKIFYPPPYERTVWHFKHANSDRIKRAIDIFDWESALNYIDANDQVSVFNSTILNIVSNFIPNETITCDDCDPPWMNGFIKNLIPAKDHFCKKFVRKSSNMYHLCAFKNLQNHLNQSIQIAKQTYINKIAQRLGDPNTSSKCYWSLLKTLLNGKKIPCIPPLFQGDKFIVDFQEKSELFNSFFADQCSPISNGSVLPSELPLRTDSSLSSCHITKDDILRIINNLDPNKAHGHDEISTRMLKICGDSICRPLSIIFKTCLRTGIFPLEWEKASIVPIHKKGDKQTAINYRPVSLLPICGKIFERLLYNEMLNVFLENDLISKKESCFRPGDSCINQLLSINHEILSVFDIGLEVRGLFLDISKAFDKVWHAGLIYKLRQNGI